MSDLHWSEVIKNLATILAIVIGGGWAYFRFSLNRDHASNLYLGLTYETHHCSNHLPIVFITVRLENRGRRKIDSKIRFGKGSNREFAYKDKIETHLYSCGLQIRKLPEATTPGVVNWNSLKDKNRIIDEVNVLDEFEGITDRAIDFHLEPNETCDITVPLALPKGHYLAKLHFVGEGGPMEYWSKVFWLRSDGERCADERTRKTDL